MNSFASSIINRLQDIVGTNQIVHSYYGLHGSNLTAPLIVTNSQDKKLIEKCYKLMDTVVQLCRQPSLNIKKSPPCLLDILPEMYSLLETIFISTPDILQTNLYMNLFMQNLYEKCKRTIKLFKEDKAKIFDETSEVRQKLTKNSLIFSHMLSELHAEFPSDGQFIGKRFRITKKEAAVFWMNSFNNKTIVSWDEFREQFNKVHAINSMMESFALKNTVDLTRNEHISNFEFDVFTRLFYPWQTLLKNWQVLTVTHPAYVSFLTYEDVKIKLQKFINKPGSYVFRLSCTKLGQWAIGYVAPDRKIYQTIPQNKSLIQSLVEGSREGFYIYPNGRNKNIDLTHALQLYPPQGRMQVTSEQYQIYCEMGTTFEMCKICDERNKNIKLEPCGHLLCKPCLKSWEESADGGGSCPFCRCEIKDTENVIIESYAPYDQSIENNSTKNLFFDSNDLKIKNKLEATTEENNNAVNTNLSINNDVQSTKKFVLHNKKKTENLQLSKKEKSPPFIMPKPKIALLPSALTSTKPNNTIIVDSISNKIKTDIMDINNKNNLCSSSSNIFSTVEPQSSTSFNKNKNFNLPNSLINFPDFIKVNHLNES